MLGPRLGPSAWVDSAEITAQLNKLGARHRLRVLSAQRGQYARGCYLPATGSNKRHPPTHTHYTTATSDVVGGGGAHGDPAAGSVALQQHQQRRGAWARVGNGRAASTTAARAGLWDFVGGDLVKPDMGRWLDDVEKHKSLAIYPPHEGGYEGRYLSRLSYQGYYFLDLSARGLGDPETTLTKIHPVCPVSPQNNPLSRSRSRAS